MEKRKRKKVVMVDSLGICQYCKRVISVMDIPLKHKGPFLPCPHCKKLTAPWDTWGDSYDRDTRISERRWVGPNGKWVRNRPKRNFIVNEFNVCVIWGYKISF